MKTAATALLSLGVLAFAAPSLPRAPSTAPTAQQLQAVLNPHPGKPKITFAPDGTFKLLVFSDLHFGENPWDDWGPEQDANSTRLMNRVLADEKPDYVVINGDLITGENTFADNSTRLIDEIVAPLNAVGVPFSSTYGNHDHQINITAAAELAREHLVAPHSYTRSTPGIGGEGGEGTYWIPVFRQASDHAPILVLWFFDSRGGIHIDGSPFEDWVDAGVATWIQSEMEVMNAVWGPSSARAELAFVHIPPHAVQALQAALNSTVDPGLNADTLGTGSTQSTSNTDEFGTDRDVPFWNALAASLPNLLGVVSGHDHGNEWCKRDSTSGIAFCFNKHSGYGGYGDPSWGYGVRNFLFKGDPREGVDTWIRLEEGEVRAQIRLDKTFE